MSLASGKQDPGGFSTCDPILEWYPSELLRGRHVTSGQDAKASHRAQVVRSCSEIRPRSGRAESAAPGQKGKALSGRLSSERRTLMEVDRIELTQFL